VGWGLAAIGREDKSQLSRRTRLGAALNGAIYFFLFFAAVFFTALFAAGFLGTS
jgi:hypothetical protein